MASIWNQLEQHLPYVNSPSQYIGGEWNAIRKDPEKVEIQVAIAFPDVYKIGMAHLGMQIFYGQLNERSDALCERIFAPWPDLEARMRENRMSGLTGAVPTQNVSGCLSTLLKSPLLACFLEGQAPLARQRSLVTISRGECGYSPITFRH